MSTDDPEIPGRPLGRRAFIGLMGAGLSSLAWGGSALQAASSASSVLPAAVRDAIPVGGQWRIYAVSPPYPRFDAAAWHLSIEGLVEHPVRLDIGQLRALATVSQTSDFHCVTGWSVTGVKWGGVRFDQLLALAKPKPEAKAVAFVSAEQPYVDTLTLEQLSAPDAMLAYDMDGRPLTREHGAPVRVVMPKMYGYKGVKWVSRIVLTDQPQDGYWEQRGYDRDAWVGRSNGV
ncbi:molybdopterin-dependent oxidoreductase [Paraconexibacter antarcticus]|uniref:Molybdopterin-dependent oxidoreductase n=1 Tax=Paraconexibacter antarcticus TaxID=2949664 RepID=A0ABY5DRV4_9ACTN|nr:molybdopterin-dependent oxidoreductase [Paraconexibacter antarcticus]UTI63988.1 molybdopterin-dependent oxidoreductase [Paraconexibacter antarcticus]